MLLGCCHCEPESLPTSGSYGSSQSASEDAPFPPGGGDDAGCGACTLFPQRWNILVPDFLQWNQDWVDYWESWQINQGLTLNDCRGTFPIGGPSGTVMLEFDSLGPSGNQYKPKWRGPWPPGGYPGYFPAPVTVCGYWASAQNAFNLTSGCAIGEFNTPVPPCGPAFVNFGQESGTPVEWRDRIPQWEMIAYQPTAANPDRDWITVWRLQFNYQYGCQENRQPFSANTHGIAYGFTINRILNNEPRKSCVVPITFAGNPSHCDNWEYPEHQPGAYTGKATNITIVPI